MVPSPYLQTEGKGLPCKHVPVPKNSVVRVAHLLAGYFKCFLCGGAGLWGQHQRILSLWETTSMSTEGAGVLLPGWSVCLLIPAVLVAGPGAGLGSATLLVTQPCRGDSSRPHMMAIACVQLEYLAGWSWLCSGGCCSEGEEGGEPLAPLPLVWCSGEVPPRKTLHLWDLLRW